MVNASRLSNCIASLNTFINKQIDIYYDKNIKFAIVFDIDDTIISTYVDNRTQEEYIRPIGLMKDVYNTVINAKNFSGNNMFDVFFVTARPVVFRKETEMTLKNHGFNKYKTLYMRNLDIRKLQSKKKLDENECVCFYKERARADIEQKHGLKVLLTIGDQETDMRGGYFIYAWKIYAEYDGNCMHTDPKKHKNVVR